MRGRRAASWVSSLVVSSFVLASFAHALETARMRLPEGFAASAERLPARGYGGANRGRFTVGAFSGDFVRIETRFAVFDPIYIANKGKSSFTLDGPGIDDTVAASCEFKERVATIGVLTFDAKKLAYVCEITEAGGGAVGQLTLGEPRPQNFKSRVLARAERQGLAEVDSVRIEIGSVHQYEGSKLASQTPVGYLLSHESLVVGAVELTDVNPTFLLRSDLAPEVRRATLIAALGLSVLRDPANSALGD